jgi:hypothetical protein
MSLPASVGLLVGDQAVGHMALLATQRDGMASFSLPLRDIPFGNQSIRDLPLPQAAAFLQRT